MKKTLLLFCCLGLAAGAAAQTSTFGPWVEVNTVNPMTVAPGYVVTDVKTVSPNVAWAVTRENSASGRSNTFVVTNNAAGDQFNFGVISAPTGSANFQAGNISAVSATTAVAAMYSATAGTAGGEVLRTANGGVTWTKVTTATQFVPSQNGFCNFVHMFDALVGVAFGDPTTGSYEILRTTDGGLTWTRLPASSSPAPLADEFGNARSFFARGNIIWAGLASATATNAIRVLKSTDRGLTWTASQDTPLKGSITRLAFKDDLNGIAYNEEGSSAGITAINVIRTADGGTTWSTITPVNTAAGSFFYLDIDAVNGRYYSVGERFPLTKPQPVAADLGSSSSTDGINWTNLNAGQEFTRFDLIELGAANATGYAGFVTDAQGGGGVFKAGSVLTATRDAALQRALSVYPNPSASGVFKVDLGSELKAGAQLTVVDALGRRVKSQTLNASVIGSKTLNLDLGNEKAGVYTLQIRTEAGIATQKLVIE